MAPWCKIQNGGNTWFIFEKSHVFVITKKIQALHYSTKQRVKKQVFKK